MQDTTRQTRVCKSMQDTTQDKREYGRYYKTDKSMQDTIRQPRVCKMLQDREEYARY